MIAGHDVRDIGSREHVVQFYRDDVQLTELVTGYLLDAARGDGVAVVIATPAHRLAFSERLTDLGVDVGSARTSGAYLDLDAQATLDEFMADGVPDPAKFDAVVGDVIRASSGHGQVRAYGEMVALLWDEGLVTAAIDLEALWNDLGQAQTFSLLCAYPSDSVTDPGQSGAFAQVCDLHADVLPSPSPVLARSFPASLDATASARHFVTQTLRDWGVAEMNGDAELTVTEFAANAVVHAHSAFTVTLAITDDTVRIAVQDSAPLAPGATLPSRPLHGLGAVAAMAADWGVEPLGDSGKIVWSELPR